jgi:hypothetical protein
MRAYATRDGSWEIDRGQLPNDHRYSNLDRIERNQTAGQTWIIPTSLTRDGQGVGTGWQKCELGANSQPHHGGKRLVGIVGRRRAGHTQEVHASGIRVLPIAPGTSDYVELPTNHSTGLRMRTVDQHQARVMARRKSKCDGLA